MASVGLVVEGIYDEAVLTELVRKCAPSGVQVICRPCGSATQVMRKFPGFLKYFEHANAGLPVDKAIVIRDADHKKPDDLIARMEDRIRGRIYPFPRKFLVIVQQLEAWLLADEDALLSVTGRPQRRISDPEAVYHPKAQLERILSVAGITYTPERAGTIAAAARPDVLAARCPSFRKFQEAVSG